MDNPRRQLLTGLAAVLILNATDKSGSRKTNVDGEEVFTLGYPKESEPYNQPGPGGKPIQCSPTNIAVAPNGDFYVGDGCSNRRLQRFTLDGKHVDSVSGINLPCHFSAFRNADMVVPDLAERISLLNRNNRVILHLGEDSSNIWHKLRVKARDKFIAVKFDSACLEHQGNIFVVEWVEVGRVTKLSKVS
jgi:hypothetical protein